MAWTDITKVRLEVADLDPSMPLLQDDTYAYYLEKNSNNIQRAALDAARVILMMLSQRGDETVDIFSIRGSKAAEQYRLALELYLSNPNLNPMLNNVQGYIGGVSHTDIQANLTNVDNNVVTNPYNEQQSKFPTNYFEV